jgi:hypothetical protein
MMNSVVSARGGRGRPEGASVMKRMSGTVTKGPAERTTYFGLVLIGKLVTVQVWNIGEKAYAAPASLDAMSTDSATWRRDLTAQATSCRLLTAERTKGFSIA